MLAYPSFSRCVNHWKSSSVRNSPRCRMVPSARFTRLEDRRRSINHTTAAPAVAPAIHRPSVKLETGDDDSIGGVSTDRFGATINGPSPCTPDFVAYLRILINTPLARTRFPMETALASTGSTTVQIDPSVNSTSACCNVPTPGRFETSYDRIARRVPSTITTRPRYSPGLSISARPSTGASNSPTAYSGGAALPRTYRQNQ